MLSTTRDAADKDYKITILSDCCFDGKHLSCEGGRRIVCQFRRAALTESLTQLLDR